MNAMLLSLMLAGTTWAALPGATETHALRAELQKQRQDIVAGVLDLTDDEELAFWPAYRDYRVEMARLGDRAVKLIDEFSANADKLSDAQAARLMDEHLAIQAERVAVRQRHVKVFRKILPATKVARFVQIENKLDATIDHELAMAIPMAMEPAAK
ncbi:MAG TPA: hypothetical protein VFV75_06165 [Candidatus Polarisedimenticolaceae bacterium]|nr:hypothetical protein [Candidatus Polarisedimenticolaceae bacterium]